MGSCCSRDSPEENLQVIDYSHYNVLNVIRRNYTGKKIGTSRVAFENTFPIDQGFESSSLGKISYMLYGCIIPGIDPRGELEKDCQDSYTFVHDESSVLCALFDGHGKEGFKVAEFCVSFTKQYFLENSEDLLKDPEGGLTRLLHKCDDELRQSKINDEMSGSTAVLIYITESSVYSASLGDSRAVLATVCDEVVPVTYPEHSYYKKVVPKRNLKPIAITSDQKPNHEDEFARIKASGGSVEQVTDDFGKPVGPHRVWVPGKDHPGLAMSRSLGDRIAKKIGVIATPVIHHFRIYPHDQFIVIGSDGLWDTMENVEVVNFVEKFKNGVSEAFYGFPVKYHNSTIARLLCEEARFRWFGIVEAEDVMIDDISCIVVDFKNISSVIGREEKDDRNFKAFQRYNFDRTPRTVSEHSFNIEDNTDITE